MVIRPQLSTLARLQHPIDIHQCPSKHADCRNTSCHTSPSGGQPEETAEHRRVTSSSDADEVYDERVAVETSFSVNPDNTSCVSSTRKLSETKPPPKKKSTAAKAMKPKKEYANVPWKTNYEIVEILCGVLDSMATSVVGNHERLGWTELVGNDKHPCPYLYSKKKVSLSLRRSPLL